MGESGEVDDLDRLKREVIYATKTYFEDIALQRTISTRWFGILLSQVKKRKLDPYVAARKLLRKSLSAA